MSKRLTLLALGLGLSWVSVAAQEQALTNQSVIDMVVGKLPKDLILQKLRSSAAVYDVSPAGLVKLNEAKVPKDIIKLMLSAPRGGEAASPLPSAAVAASAPDEEPLPAPPASSPRSRNASPAPTESAAVSAHRKPKPDLIPIPSETGIHVRADGIPLTFLEPTSYTAGRTSNALGAALSGGLSKAKMKSSVSGAEASIRFADPYPEFYFIFEQRGATLSNSNQWWSQLTSPNQFTLVRLEKKESRREVTTASMGAFSAQSGTEDKAIVAFTLTRLKPGVYRVVPRGALIPGEYAFFPASMGGGGTAGANMLFDFGVDP